MPSGSSILIIAGEESGDRHGAALVEQMKKRDSTLSFFGVGGNALSLAGMDLLEHVDRMSVMGFAEVVLHYRFLRRTFQQILAEADIRRPARAILIDYPGFNLKLAKKLKERHIPVTYYISPQMWAWKEGRISVIRDCVDQMICIFPFEEKWYKERGVKAQFVGHPFMDGETAALSREEFVGKHGLTTKKQIIALMPGSRQQEVNRHLKVMLKALERLQYSFDVEAIIGKANGVILSSSLPDRVSVETEAPECALMYSTAAIVSSGTISLQAAVYGIPSVVIYKMNPLSWLIAKRVLRVDHVSMTNLIAGKKVLPELLQNGATDDTILSELSNWLSNEEYSAKTRGELRAVKGKLGSPGASQRAAQAILGRLQQ
jgi:lipid-A-disaccharide synthase